MNKQQEKVRWEQFQRSFPEDSYSAQVLISLVPKIVRDISDDIIWQNFDELKKEQEQEKLRLEQLKEKQKEIEQKLKSMMTTMFWMEQSIQRMRDAIDPQKWMEKLGEARAEVEHCRQIIKSI